MKNFKIILGIVLIVFGTITIIQMASEERGAGLGGALSGYVIILGISIWLIYSANKVKSNSENSLNLNFKEQKTNHYKQNKPIKSSINEQKENLKILKNEGVLSDTEYEEKIDIINNQIILEKVNKLIEYKSLKKVLDSDLLSKEQFEEKTDKLIADYKEYYSIFGENSYPEFTWDLYKTMKINQKYDTADYTKNHLYGNWEFKDGQINFYQEKENNADKLKIRWNNGTYINCEWELNDSIIHLKRTGKVKSKVEKLRIDELGTNILVFYANENKYSSIKYETE
ncbi:hypothetical protein BWZ20_15000 [Winogradskyella sp. J14-2]|uniref:hypothetical protein n=1 Tax=Winogradskyella sp. J14-2 TaxID=1936080 RepID=UPI0009728CF3|nr:hypothetical protein [Winogradskyella sp. J14-2]APY09530.1 hypothetical protein BWZ20_15000 [Winogradskyella sp. J14-2]